MPPLALFLLFLIVPRAAFCDSGNVSFTKGFTSQENMSLYGGAKITSNRALALSNGNGRNTISYAFYSNPISFKSSPNSPVDSFNVSFVFAIYRGFSTRRHEGMAFVVAPTKDLPDSEQRGYLSLFNDSNPFFAVTLDSNWNEVGIYNGTVRTERGTDRTLHLDSGNRLNGKRMHVSIVYQAASHSISVSLEPFVEDEDDSQASFDVPANYDLSSIMNREMYAGFASTNGLNRNYVLGWSLKINGAADELKTCHVAWPPPNPAAIMIIVVSVVAFASLLGAGVFLAYYVRRRMEFAELIEGWEGELNYASHRFKYKDLYIATKGFKDTELLGVGGFGQVYKGVMPGSRAEIALKRISHESQQGMKEFIAEIVSLGRLRHRNLVPLLGYCRRRRELLLVYEYMPNGSLDRFLHSESAFTLNWYERFRIIKGVARGLVYLHEEWEQVVIHRDIKPGNVLLDSDLNARLGDFGLARLHDHGSNPSTTKIVGTLGYLAPEHTRTGRATKSSDVYGFGALVLEVVSGRRPIEPSGSQYNTVLVDWVHSLWRNKQILGAVDPNIGPGYPQKSAELVLKLGMWCSHPQPDIRPGTRDIVRYLEDPSTFPDSECTDALGFWFSEGYDEFRSLVLSSASSNPSGAFSISHSLVISGGR